MKTSKAVFVAFFEKRALSLNFLIVVTVMTSSPPSPVFIMRALEVPQSSFPSYPWPGRAQRDLAHDPSSLSREIAAQRRLAQSCVLSSPV
ncbi:hypothetical protein JB92DRAFT_2945791 [Gautieria morchelliformis]|nr:hypothetical protein JB92DRAFT_2945732 [Gautieria morchelliformis]KAF8509576.1 hypothetical protein JB92DRAFT_2945791 [Gautieria morchelliformis]